MQTLFGSVLAAILLTIAIIDMRTLRIPLLLNIALAVLGVVWTALSAPAELVERLASALVIAGLLWAVSWLSALRTGRVGLGLGDVRMAGAGALWLPPVLLSAMMFGASVTCLAYAGIRHLAGSSAGERLAFGPFIALAIMGLWLMERQFDGN